MKKAIYDYINEHKVVSTHYVSDNLNLPNRIVTMTIEELRRKRLLRLCTPVPLGSGSETSCFYTTTSKGYQADILLSNI